MTKRRMFLAVAGLVAANASLAMSLYGDTGESAGPVYGTCVCVDGSDPNGPGQPPYDPQCWELMTQECSANSQCSCS